MAGRTVQPSIQCLLLCRLSPSIDASGDRKFDGTSSATFSDVICANVYLMFLEPPRWNLLTM